MCGGHSERKGKRQKAGEREGGYNFALCIPYSIIQ